AIPWFTRRSWKSGPTTRRRAPCRVRAGDGRSGAIVALTTVHASNTHAAPSIGRISCEVFVPMAQAPISGHRVDGETLRILLGLGRVEGDAVEQGFFLHVLTRRLDAHLLGHLAEDVGTMHAVDEALVFGRLLDHPPAPELREPPDAMRLHREVGLAVEEGHVVLVFLSAPVAVVVVAEHAAEDDLL